MITGSVQIKNNYYYLVINLYVNGVRRQKWISTRLPVKGNKRKAERMLTEEIARLENNENHEKIVFSDYCIQWLNNQKISLEANTFSTYKNQVRRIVDYFGPKKTLIQEMTPLQIRDFYHFLATEGNLRTGKPLGARTIRDIAQRLRSILSDATTMKLINDNPAVGVKPPRPLDTDRQQDHDDVYLDEKDLQLFLEAAKDEPLYDLFRVTVFLGLRREEAGGLNWNRVNFENRTVTIMETRVRAGKEEITKSRTKNSSSYRTYPMGDYLYGLLCKIKDQQEENRQLFGKSYVENENEVFTWPNGRPFRLDYITKRFKQIILNIPELDSRLHFHSLRASCISNLFKQGYGLKEVQKWVGQNDVETTLRIYNKFKQEEKQRVSEGLDNMFQQIEPNNKC